ncbi:MAG: YeeE/YedE family protein [Proteobacteria bacterium]|nr:YeeE/YedE family protein [Pseudomonadota bacterium]
MKKLIYLTSGLIFGLGLSLSGMINPLKVKAFLSVGFNDWNPALIFVLGSAVPVYLISFLYLRRKQMTLNATEFKHPAPRPIDKKLVVGAILFGVGWGIAGICPGPALVHVAFLDMNFVIFIVTMFAGFELQRRLT